jgi:hypothetical protein
MSTVADIDDRQVGLAILVIEAEFIGLLSNILVKCYIIAETDGMFDD